MMLAARGAFLAARRNRAPTARSYVQDGLVAMWDGIENAGWGVHDASATTWTNLVTGAKASLPSGFTVGDDSINIANKSSYLVVSDYSGDSFTCEYVFKLVDTRTAQECIFESVSANNGFRLKYSSYVRDYWMSGGYDRNLFYANGNINVVKHISAAWADVYMNSGSFGSDYVDGQLVGTGSLKAAQRNLGGFRIGRASYTTNQNVYSVRIYNRPITASEIAANCAIDKERFNRP